MFVTRNGFLAQCAGEIHQQQLACYARHFLAQKRAKKKGSRKALDGKLRHVCCTKNIAHNSRVALQAFSVQCSFKNLKGKNCAKYRRGNCGTQHKLLTKRCCVTNRLFE